jgi:hypothetical protein
MAGQVIDLKRADRAAGHCEARRVTLEPLFARRVSLPTHNRYPMCNIDHDHPHRGSSGPVSNVSGGDDAPGSLHPTPITVALASFAVASITCAPGAAVALVQPPDAQHAAYSTSLGLKATRRPAEQFAFLIGKWRAAQLFPVAAIADLYEDWTALADGSLLGQSYSSDKTVDQGDPIEIRLVIEDGRYVHTLRSRAFTGGTLMKMPVVQASRSTFVSVNGGAHIPARTTYDLLKDGTMIATIYVAETGSCIVYKMTRL